MRSYGVVVPPFPACFIEADVVVPGAGLVQLGTLVEDASQAYRDGTLPPVLKRNMPPSTNWLIVVNGFMHSPLTREIQRFAGMMLFHLNAHGELLDDMERVEIVEYEPDKRHTLPGTGLPGLAPCMLKAISVMHQRAAADKVTPQRQARRAAERQGVKELHEYYVLRVLPTSAPRDMSEVGQPSKAAGQRREHMVRGHFRFYTPERPLFGHTSGMVWIPAHERGDSDIGHIRKDYEV